MSGFESQIWAIAIKGDQSRAALEAETKEFAKCYDFRVPTASFRVGTLDSLMSLSDDLAKMDTLAEGTVSKFYKQLLDLLQPRRRSLVSCDRLVSQGRAQSDVMDTGLVLQQREAQPAEAMGPTGDEHIIGAGCVAMQTQGSETAKGCD